MKIFIYFTIYLFIYQNIAFIPKFYGSYYHLLSFIFLFFNIIYYLHKKRFKKINFDIFVTIIFILIFYFISIIYNGRSFLEINPVRNVMLKLFLDINYFVFILNILSRIGKNSIYIFKGYIYVVFIDVIFSLIRFRFNFINSIFIKIYPPNNDIIVRYLISKVRFMGLGGFFFSGGIILSIALILITYLIVNNFISNKEKCIFYFLYIFIFLIGILISRTTIIGFILSIFYYLKNKKYMLFKMILLVLFSTILLFVLFQFLDKKIQEWIIYFIYIRGQKSLMSLIAMYEIFPNNIKTFFIGDGLWGDVNRGYYMNTDIGYIRTIFFNGVIALILQIIFNYKLTRIKDPQLKELSIILFFLYLILNLKGYVAYLPISLFIYVYSFKNERMKNDKNKHNSSCV